MRPTLHLALLAASCTVRLAPGSDLAGSERATVPGLVGTHQVEDLAALTITAPYTDLLVPAPLGDLTGDGRDDVIYVQVERPGVAVPVVGSVHVLRGPDLVEAARIDGLPSAQTHWGWSVEVGDLGSDGTEDLILLSEQQAWVFYGRLAPVTDLLEADATFLAPLTGGAAVRDAAVADVDLDGAADLVLDVEETPGHYALVAFHEPRGVLLSAAALLNVPYGPQAIEAFDLDGDGALEIVGLHAVGGSATTYEVPGLGSAGWRAGAAEDGGFAVSDDLSGDGLPDVVLGYPADGSLEVLTGSTALTLYGASGVSYADHLAAIGDMDGDGAADLLVEHDYGHAVLLYGPLFGADAFRADILGVDRFSSGGDFDGDGTVDLVFADSPYLAGLHQLFVVRGVPAVMVDDDGDGFDPDIDCDDQDAAIFPGAPEWCDGLDSDCDGQVDGDACLALAVRDLDVGDLVVTELMIDPTACADGVAEWIEIYNAADGPVDLAGMVVRDEAGTTGTIGVRSIVEAGDYAVLGTSTATSFCVASAADPVAYYGSTPQLNNTGDLVRLEDGAGRTLDVIPRLRSPSPGVSIALDEPNPDAGLNDAAASWVASTAPIGLERGTPGAPNVTERRLEDLQAGDLVITEFMADPTVASDTTSEWIELYNPLTVGVDLAGLTLLDRSGNVGTIGPSVVVPSHGYAVVARGTGSSFGYPFTPAATWGTQLSLNNDTDQVTILAQGRTIDIAASYTRPVPGSSQALGGPPDAVLNDDGSAWRPSTAPLGADRGTPGAPNLP